MEVWRGLLPGRREQKPGFLPARENRSSAWACTQKEPRACAAGQRNKPGARLARRSRATCPPQVCSAQARAFSLPGKTGARREARTRNQPRACETRGRKRQGARIARRSRAGKKQTGQTALWAADTLQAASRVTDGACAICSPQVRGRARLGKETNQVRELPTAGAGARRGARTRNQPRACAVGQRNKPGARIARRSRGLSPCQENRSRARACTWNQPRACEAGQSHKHGARIARRSRAGEKVLRNFAGKGLTIRTSYIIINNAPQ